MAEKTLKQRVNRLLDIVAVCALAILAWSAWEKLSITPDDYLIVDKVYVHDFAEGQDGEVVYDRTILQSFKGDWYVRVFPVDGSRSICDGSGTTWYEPGGELSGITLSWYVGKDCGLTAGQYFIKTVWQLPGGLVQRNTSDVFRVVAPGDLDNFQQYKDTLK